MSKKSKFKFDVVIGNPPFQESMEGTSDKQIFPDFMDQSYKVAKQVEFITPGKFLFNTGKTSKKWNTKMLNDQHLKVLFYEPNSKKVFSNTDIKGGITVTLRNMDKNFGAIKFFTPFSLLSSVVKKVVSYKNFVGLSKIIYAPESYKLTKKLHIDFSDIINKLSKGHANDVTTNIFDKLPNIFVSSISNNDVEYVKIYGRQGNERVYKYIKKEYISGPENFEYWKV